MANNNIVIEQLLDQWESKVRQTTETFKSLGSKHAMQPVAPGRNRIIYLLGHLLAVQDRLFDAMELGDAIYPELDDLFLAPQHASNVYPPFEELLCKWVVVNDLLAQKLRKLEAEDWLKKHRYVTDEEFLEHPYHNKLNLMLSRVFHLYHHGGQLVLVE